MTASGSKLIPSIGFLTVREYEDLGLIGGYLVLNTIGRPLEFHCTAPLRPNRPQQILYGPTLEPFLYGERIGHTLVSKGRNEPLFVCTDVQHALALRSQIELPVVWMIRSGGERDPQTPQRRLDACQPTPPTPKGARLFRFELGPYAAAVPESHQADREVIEQRWQPHAEDLDLAEPFARLAEAIDEAQRGASR